MLQKESVKQKGAAFGQLPIRQYKNIADIGELPYRVRQEKMAILGFYNKVSPFFIINTFTELLFPRALSQVAMLAWIFGDCREGQIPRCCAALQIYG